MKEWATARAGIRAVLASCVVCLAACSGSSARKGRPDSLAQVDSTTSGTEVALDGDIESNDLDDEETPRSPSVDEIQSGKLPNIPLLTQDDKPVRFYDDLVKGKVVMINFMFTMCQGSCPGTSAKLAKVQDALGDRVGRDVFILSISLDPEKDTPTVLKQYAERYGARPGWSFLTGNRSDIEGLRHRLGLFDPDPVVDADKTQHAGVILLGNGAIGRWSRILALAKPQQILDALDRVALDPQKWKPAMWSSEEPQAPNASGR
ncbi:MAG: SCO family protein [Planctomycetes bacterium]|nr:SCO family protein [Planctomycetota bacterium]MBI3847340.1 SCO family protein [Planctomycetota bacterium]